MALENIEHVIILMLENRSFDQMLGYLSLDETHPKLPVDGLRSPREWREQFTNLAGGKSYPIKKLSGTQKIRQDPPHGRDSIDTQINRAPQGPEATKMGGFVETYLAAHKKVTDPGAVMGYYDAKDVPTYDFLARNFCVCDRWFTSLPLGTQANRLMAMSGESLVLDNVTRLPDQKLVYDWLEEKQVSWRTYVSGGYAPFFILMFRWSFRILKSLGLGSGPFRRFSKFREHWQSDAPMPSVIFIEPEYADAPMSDPNDAHPPAQIGKGQELVRAIYEAVTSNAERWGKTLMIITYDEHGGFFDHVPPLGVAATVNGTELATTGPRVPAILVSPHVGAGQVFSEPLDHTSVLQLIADRFGGGGSYSAAVTQRQSAFGRIANALLPEARPGRAPVMPPRKAGARRAATVPLSAVPTAPSTPNAAAIDAIMRDFAREHPELIDQPAWAQMRVYLETNSPPTPEHQEHSGDLDEPNP
jgi:phospholipase C